MFPKLKRLMDDPPRIGGKYDNLVRKLPTNHSVFYNAEADNFERVDHKKVLKMLREALDILKDDINDDEF